MQPIYQFKEFKNSEEFVTWQKEQITDFTISQISPVMFASEPANHGAVLHSCGLLVVYYQH